MKPTIKQIESEIRSVKALIDELWSNCDLIKGSGDLCNLSQLSSISGELNLLYSRLDVLYRNLGRAKFEATVA